MKHKGCSEFEFKRERDIDLLAAYNKAITQSSFPIKLHDVLVRTVNTPSARFWVSSKRAMLVMLDMKAGKDLKLMKANKQRMFREIYNRVTGMENTNPDLSLSQIVEIVVEQQAPCFYMTPGSAQVIIHYAKKRCYEKKLKQLRYYW